MCFLLVMNTEATDTLLGHPYATIGMLNLYK